MRHLMKSAKLLTMMASLLSLSACAPQQFEPVPVKDNVGLNNPQSNQIASNFFKMSGSQTSVDQPVLDQNQTSVSFQVKLPDGTYSNNIQTSDLVITENGLPVSQFQLSSNSQTIVQTVDIVFAVDVTNSMGPTIESAKTRLINFIQSTRARGYHTRMCLVTFGDFTIKHCNKFYDNDPNDPSTQAQMDELTSEITKLKAFLGAEDPGGLDYNENPMRALIDASNAPWGADSQRFTILITDDGLLYSPGNSGSVADLAPKYPDVMTAITNSQMKVFLAAPSHAGYNSSFQGSPSIVSKSGGQFFLYSDLIAGTITLDTILNAIISKVKTTYVAQYVSDLITGLDPSLPLAQRNIVVSLRPGMPGTVNLVSNQSSLPNGRGQYLKNWKLTDKKIDVGSLQVAVNGNPVNSGFHFLNGDLVFDVAPPAGAKITVNYNYQTIADSIQISQIILNKGETINSIAIFFNDIKATAQYVTLGVNIEGQVTIQPSAAALVEADPFKIRQYGGLNIVVQRVTADPAPTGN